MTDIASLGFQFPIHPLQNIAQPIFSVGMQIGFMDQNIQILSGAFLFVCQRHGAAAKENQVKRDGDVTGKNLHYCPRGALHTGRGRR